MSEEFKSIVCKDELVVPALMFVILKTVEASGFELAK